MAATRTTAKATKRTVKAPQRKVPAKKAAKPRAPKQIATDVTVTMPATTFANALKNALISASRDDLRPVLSAALFEFPAGMTRIVSTDSYSLLVQEMPREGGEAATSVLVRRADLLTWERVLRLLPKPKRPARARRRRWDPAPPAPELVPQMVTLAVTSDRVEMTAGEMRVAAKPMVEQFPNWENLVSAAVGAPTSGCAVDPSKMRALAGLVSLNGITNPCLTLTPQDALKPLRLSLRQGEGYRVDALLMPVRVS